jgi:hypothetical protein
MNSVAHRKPSWAEQYLKKLEAAIDASPIHAPTYRREGQQQWRLADRTIPLIVGDFLYNARVSFDYVACALVPSAERRSVGFPIVRGTGREQGAMEHVHQAYA